MSAFANLIFCVFVYLWEMHEVGIINWILVRLSCPLFQISDSSATNYTMGVFFPRISVKAMKMISKRQDEQERIYQFSLPEMCGSVDPFNLFVHVMHFNIQIILTYNMEKFIFHHVYCPVFCTATEKVIKTQTSSLKSPTFISRIHYNCKRFVVL